MNEDLLTMFLEFYNCIVVRTKGGLDLKTSDRKMHVELIRTREDGFKECSLRHSSNKHFINDILTCQTVRFIRFDNFRAKDAVNVFWGCRSLEEATIQRDLFKNDVSMARADLEKSC